MREARAVTIITVMDPLTLTASTFTVKGPDGQAISGAVTYAGNVATFTADTFAAAVFTAATFAVGTFTVGTTAFAFFMGFFPLLVRSSC